MSHKFGALPLFIATLSALLLGACASQSVPQMNATDMSGDDFNHHLARNYKEFANYQAKEMWHWDEAVDFANKSMAAAAGNPPPPDDLSTRQIKDKEQLAALQSARVRLMQALAAGAAQKAPADAANAQSNFDCWAEEQEEGWETEEIARCKNGFESAMHATEMAMAPAPQPMAQSTPPAPAQRFPYLVLFNWDRSNLTSDATAILDRVVQRVRSTDENVQLVGHTDSSGSNAYNMKLSQTRAETVRRYLIAHGVPANSISTRWVGETEPMVATANGVREAQNRWVGVELVPGR
jgi:OOP family OmpA-OmpF porin